MYAHMSCSIRYYRPGPPKDVGFLIIANESELAVHKARLEASGYVVVDNTVTPPLTISAGRSQIISDGS